jgi:hypothetical protein
MLLNVMFNLLQLQFIVLLRSVIELLQHLNALKYKKIKKFKYKTKLKIVGGVRKRIRRIPKRNRFGFVSSPIFDTREETGLFKNQFDIVFSRVAPLIEESRTGKRRTAVSLQTESRLYMVINFLRAGGRFRRLQEKYKVSRSFISRELHHIIPRLYSVLDFIRWPEVWTPKWYGSVAAIDCSVIFFFFLHFF